jgi:glycosyltransferase involved in cell wall biosynthesis
MNDANSISKMHVSVVIPCLNEERTIGECVKKALDSIAAAGINGEVIVSDNGSHDNSREIATQQGAILVSTTERGYGSALMTGFQAARGTYIFMADADCSYDFSELSRFLAKLEEGFDLVMGCRLPRYRGKILPGAMPLLHKILGNPLVSKLGTLFFHTPIHDFCCGMRAFSRDEIMRLALRGGGMEFALEMIVKASIAGLRITEIPITLYPDKRGRRPHLRTWVDGWKHVKFLLLLAPHWLFLYPGLFITTFGTCAFIALWSGPVTIANVSFDTNSLIIAGTSIIIGCQILIAALLAKLFIAVYGLAPNSTILKRLTRCYPSETGLILGSTLIGFGSLGIIRTYQLWEEVGFGALSYSQGLRLIVPGVTAIILGCMIIFGGFLITMMLLLESHSKVSLSDQEKLLTKKPSLPLS